MKEEIQGADPRGLYDPTVDKDACGLGLIVDGSATARHSVVTGALGILRRLAHRGAVGADGRTGDGAGILLQIPDNFFRGQEGLNFLPAPGAYAVGTVFLPREKSEHETLRKNFTSLAEEEGLAFLGERRVETSSSALGTQARLTEPAIWQWFVAPLSGRKRQDAAAFPLALYRLRQRAERAFRKASGARDPLTGLPLRQFYLAGLSSQTLHYKGLLLPEDFERYFPELSHPDMQSAFALVHSRFSTNTLPAWELAHPYRLLCHNGEINTLKGNLSWMKARERGISTQLHPAKSSALLPLIGPGQSDSQSLDNLVELLTLSGRELPHALMMAVPEVWEGQSVHGTSRTAFNSFHSHRLEPWDGPAALGFSDGHWVGACLDRNGLRPCRYQVLTDGTLILASEAGVLDTPASQVVKRGKLGPGQLLAFHLKEKRLYGNRELRDRFAGAQPFGQWVKEESRELPAVETSESANFSGELAPTLRRYGYTAEELTRVLLPMLQKGEEAVSSMGNDTPLAVLSELPQPIFRYFRQTFAQVTNPPIDSEREQVAMSLTSLLGPRADLFSLTADGRKRIKLKGPVLGTGQFEALSCAGLRAHTVSLLFPTEKQGALRTRVRELCTEAEAAVRSGCELLILSDRAGGADAAPVPALLALSAVHHHLIRIGLRTEASLIVDTGEARDVHHFACLIGFGAEAVHPYLLPAIASRLAEEGTLLSSAAEAEANFLKAVEKGLRKILAKMGISTISSYCGAQIFEILGLGREITEECFPSASSAIGGLGFHELEEETLRRHAQGNLTPEGSSLPAQLTLGGQIHYRPGGETHLWNPTTIAKLQIATRENNPLTYQEFSEAADALSAASTLRGLLNLKSKAGAIPVDEVEPVRSILKRFSTGAMSFGALGKEAHETLAVAMNRLGARSNSGEGGEDSRRFAPDERGDSRNSAIKQIASGRFGVTAHYLSSASELQIKMAQGAKPGEGGQLPGHKVDKEIARLRHSTPGVTLISPPPHHDIYSIEDLAQLIFDLKNSNPVAAVSVKLVAESGVGTIAAGVAKAYADKIVISGDSGGTGASPLSSIQHAGSPWELGLAETQQALVANGLRARVRLEADGQLKTGRDVLVAALLGADEFGFSTAPLIVEGCVMMRKCHLNTCPVGVATQDPELRAKFNGQPEYLIRYFHFVAEEVRALLASLGFRSLDEAIGRVDCLEARIPAGKASGLDLSRILAKAESRIPGHRSAFRFGGQRSPRPQKALDEDLLPLALPAIVKKESLRLRRTIRNSDRSTGTLLSYHVAKAWGAGGLPPDTLRLELTGTAGQSFGAFLARGIVLNLEGEANDYVGKGLSGGSIRIFGSRRSPAMEAIPVLAGNTCLYGATSGELFLAGAAGERFAVRNSGALAVVEGVGEHGCEYMTGGDVIVLGPVGKNFAAGMSGGTAYVYDPHRRLRSLCHPAQALPEPVAGFDDSAFLFSTIDRHWQLTGSRMAEALLNHWETALAAFVKIVPAEYRSALAQLQPERSPPVPVAAQEQVLYG
ncbi:MAG TPA: glutamate synthase large subunit [Bdellovibrionota bacterium]|jgi:glutamate synthase (NADPH/NADH) large chain/glutamate synthase (ferredoxin)